MIHQKIFAQVAYVKVGYFEPELKFHDVAMVL
jgi:hypothetical protein